MHHDGDISMHNMHATAESGGRKRSAVGLHISFSPFLDAPPSTSTTTPAITQEALTVDNTTRASTAMKHLRSGRRLIYIGGDYHNARQLLQAIKHKITQESSSLSSLPASRMRKKMTEEDDNDMNTNTITKKAHEQWTQYRKIQQLRSDIARGLLIQVSFDATAIVVQHNHCDNLKYDDNNTTTNAIPLNGSIIGLKRTPKQTNDVLQYAFQNNEDRKAIITALASKKHTNSSDASLPSSTILFFLSLSEFIGMIGGYEWHRKGIYVHAIQDYIYPHYGVFPPTHQDYMSLLDNIIFDNGSDCSSSSKSSGNACRVEKGNIAHHSRTMLEVGIGSGILSTILLKRGQVDHVTGTDINPYAIACAYDNMRRLGLSSRINLLHVDLFPPIVPVSPLQNSSNIVTTGYDIVLFNPPWLPGNASSYLDKAVYDPDQMVLRRFLCQVQHYVKKEGGYIYIMLSNLGILLGLFSEQDLHSLFDDGNLELVEQYRYHHDSNHHLHLHKSGIPGRSVRKAGRRIRSTNHAMGDEGSYNQQNGNNFVASARAQEVISLYKLRVRRNLPSFV